MMEEQQENFWDLLWIACVASWHSNSGPHQENHKVRIMHVPILLPQAHKTCPTKCCSQNVIKRKLWRPALSCENLMSYMAALCYKNQRPHVFLWRTNLHGPNKAQNRVFPPSPLLKINYSVTKECGTRPGN